MRYCPLCKAEYRDGFDRCSDCLIGLVTTREEADAAEVCLLWEGTQLAKFNGIVWALGDANVPNLARSGANPKRGLSVPLGIFSFFRRAKGFHQNMSWQVFVLKSDYAKARETVENQV
jgi:hypothetical protein